MNLAKLTTWEKREQKKRRQKVLTKSMIGLIIGLLCFLMSYSRVLSSDLTDGAWVLVDRGLTGGDYQTVIVFNELGRVTTGLRKIETPIQTEQDSLGSDIMARFYETVTYNGEYDFSAQTLTFKSKGGFEVRYDVEWVNLKRNRLKIYSETTGDVFELVKTQPVESITN